MEVGRGLERVRVEHGVLAAAGGRDRGGRLQGPELLEDLGLDVRVRAEHVEEPGERGDDEVLGREHVSYGGVPEELVALPLAHAGVPRPRHVQ